MRVKKQFAAKFEKGKVAETRFDVALIPLEAQIFEWVFTTTAINKKSKVLNYKTKNISLHSKKN